MEKPRNERAWLLVLPVCLLVSFNAIIPLMTVVNYSVQDIVTPLDALASRTIADLAELVDRISGDPSTAAFREIDRRQDQVVVEMRLIAENMTKWEGFHETITLLQTIIRMQKQLQEETDETLNRQLDDIFEDN